MIVSHACFTIDPSRIDEVKRRTAEHVESTASERNALAYEFLVNATDPSKVYIYAEWPDRASMEAWRDSETHTQAGVKLRDCFISSEVRTFECQPTSE